MRALRKGLSIQFMPAERSARVRFCLLLSAALALAGCGESELTLIGWEGSEDVTLSATACSAGLCGAHGTCDDSTGKAVCTCEVGYRGADCARCAAGYVSDGAGQCVDAASTADVPDAGTGSGEARPDAGAAQGACASSGLSCGDHGDCIDASGTAQCACDEGYAGANCQSCAAGYQDRDGDGRCLPNCATASLSCGDHGTCSDASGRASCTCDEGYAGANCQSCAAGYQDRDGDGRCLPSCATASLSCGANAACSDASGTAQCVCQAGYVLYNGACTLESSIVEWTVVVFLNGDNDLNASADEDLKEMQSLTNDSKINVIVLYDSLGTGDTVVYRIKRGGKEKLENVGTAIYSGNEADMGNAETLRKFGVWAIQNYPAKKYALVMWNHGGGWRNGEPDGRCRRAAAFKDFSTDETNESVITLANGAYANAIKAISAEAGKKLDLIGFDTCLMGMYEVAAVNAPYGDYLVASAESEPAYGWAYDVVMKALGKTPSMDAVTLGKTIVDAYHDDRTINATLALFDLSEADNMTAKINTFASGLTTALSTPSAKNAVKSIRENTQHYDYSEHVDLKHFATQIKNNTSLSSTLRDAASAVIAQISSFIVYAKVQSSPAYWGHSHASASGLAIFFPETFDECYAEIAAGVYEFYSIRSPCETEQQEVSGYYSETEMATYKSGKGAVWSSNWKTFVRKYSGID